MTYQECLNWLYDQLPMYQRIGKAAYKADLKGTEDLMEVLGHPENKFKSIHIAGTNGKGSVAHMLAALFQQSGYKTGLYTSPHLKDFRERVRINGSMINEDAVLKFVESHKAKFEEIGLSFFEMTVGLAFDHFAKEEVDIAIVEVGMGGRLDSTNVITPELSIITNISLDHTQFLGHTEALIASEKAGIIKEGIPVVIGEKHPDTLPIFKEVAAQKNARLILAEEEISLREVRTLDLEGRYQERNMRTALAAVHELEKQGYQFEDIDKALANVKKLTGLQGRWEILGDRPKIIADTAHNLAGLEVVLEQLKRESYRQLHIVFGTVSDKNLSEILRMLPKAAIYYFCKPNLPRGKDADALKSEALRFGLSGKTYPSVKQALEAAINHTLADDLIFVGGSNFVVAEVI